MHAHSRFQLRALRSTLVMLALLSGAAFAADSVLLGNNSFERNANTGAGYMAPNGWIVAGSGGMTRSTLIADNGALPDQLQLLALHPSASVYRTSNPLAPANPLRKYRLQAWLNVRNAFGPDGTNLCNVGMDFAGERLETFYGLTPVGGGNPYYCVTVPFVPLTSDGPVAITSLGGITDGGGAELARVLLVDAVCMDQRGDNNVVLQNPGFEACGRGKQFGAGELLAGWRATGTFGADDMSGPLSIPSNDCWIAGFVKGAGSLSQTINGLMNGSDYLVSFMVNASGTVNNFTVQMGASTLCSIPTLTPRLDWYRTSLYFTASAGALDLVFAAAGTPAGSAFLIDNVAVVRRAPDEPNNISPGNGAAGVPVAPYLLASAFVSQFAGDTHVASQWQIATDRNCNNVIWDSGEVYDELTVMSVPGDVLSNGARYFWRVRYRSNYNFSYSGYSVPTPFTVVASGGGSVQRSVILANPSFEVPDGRLLVDPAGYTEIANWTRTTIAVGVNPCSNGWTGLADNGARPDGNQVAFLQNYVDFGPAGVYQAVAGLDTNTQYNLQFWYNSCTWTDANVTNVCNLAVTFGSQTLALISNITPVETAGSFSQPMYFTNIIFTPSVAAANLQFLNLVISNEGSRYESRLMLDAITLFRRANASEVVVRNPSFEASGEPRLPYGYIYAPWEGNFGNVAGWQADNAYGVNKNLMTFIGGAPVPEGNNAFFNNANIGNLNQDIAGLTAGQNYMLHYAYNARPGFPVSNFFVLMYSTVIQDLPWLEYNAAGFYTTNVRFTATAESMNLSFSGSGTGATDGVTILIDDVWVHALPVTNQPPVMPVNQSPAHKSTYQSLTPLLQASTFDDPDGDPQTAAQWQMATDAAFTALTWDSGATSAATQITAPALAPSLRYYWRVRYQDSVGLWSDYALPTWFETRQAGSSTVWIDNPSFEADGTPSSTFGHLSQIKGWSCTPAGAFAAGINPSAVSSPFANNGAIPDRGHVVFLQDSRTLMQELSDLDTTKQYWLQVWYTARDYADANSTNLCHFGVDFAGTRLLVHSNVAPVDAAGVFSAPYHFTNIAFHPTASAGTLALRNLDVPWTNAWGAQLGRALVLDCVVLLQRDADEIVVVNPSFEGSGMPFGNGEVLAPQSMGGWSADVEVGINRSGGPFVSGAVVPEGQNVYFHHHDAGALRQTLAGLTPGATYYLNYWLNARGGPGISPVNNFSVQLGGTQLCTVAVVSNTTLFRQMWHEFIAAAPTAAVVFTTSGSSGDSALLLDNISLRPVPEPAWALLLGLALATRAWRTKKN